MIPDFACPRCSHLRTEHNGLFEDELCIPAILSSTPRPGVRYRDGKFRVIGCPCIKPAYGPHQTEQAAKDAIAMCLAALRADCAEARREMEAV